MANAVSMMERGQGERNLSRAMWVEAGERRGEVRLSRNVRAGRISRQVTVSWAVSTIGAGWRAFSRTCRSEADGALLAAEKLATVAGWVAS